MLSIFPRFNLGEYVIRESIDDGLYVVRKTETKFIFFHQYYLDEVGVEAFDHPEFPKSISYPFKEKKLSRPDWKTDIIPYLGKIIFEYIGSQRKGKPWTHIENNILKRFYNEFHRTELELIFFRSFRAIRIQYNKVKNK